MGKGAGGKAEPAETYLLHNPRRRNPGKGKWSTPFALGIVTARYITPCAH